MPLQQPKPGRPFGVTIAIFASVIIFSIVPLMQVGLILLVEQHFANRDNTLVLPDGTESTGITGGDLRGDLADSRIYLQGALAVVFFVLAFLAWVGRPPFIRFAFMGAVLLYAALTIALTIAPAFQQGGRGLSGGSLSDVSPVLLAGQFVVSVLVPLYVVWYLNRAPARAFYRGYYLPTT